MKRIPSWLLGGLLCELIYWSLNIYSNYQNGLAFFYDFSLVVVILLFCFGVALGGIFSYLTKKSTSSSTNSSSLYYSKGYFSLLILVFILGFVASLILYLTSDLYCALGGQVCHAPSSWISLLTFLLPIISTGIIFLQQKVYPRYGYLFIVGLVIIWIDYLVNQAAPLYSFVLMCYALFTIAAILILIKLFLWELHRVKS